MEKRTSKKHAWAENVKSLLSKKMSINSNFVEFKDSIISLTAILTTKRYTANFNNELPQKISKCAKLNQNLKILPEKL